MAKMKEKISRISDMAVQAAKPVTVDISSNKEALLNGCRGVVEYNESTVKINCGSLIIEFNGSNLGITSLSVDEILVTGEIIKIEFSNC